MTQSGEQQGTQRWLGFLLGMGSAFATQASAGVPDSWPRLFLLLGGVVGAGLLTQTALDRASRGIEGSPEPKPVRRRRELVAWVVILLIVSAACLGVAALVERLNERLAGCPPATPVPVVAAPSVLEPVRELTEAWQQETRRAEGCPRYEVQLSVAGDRDVAQALQEGWPGGDDGRPNYLGAIGPTPLLWFPDDHRWISTVEAGLNNRTSVRAKVLYGSSALAVAVPTGVREQLSSAATESLATLRVELARLRVALVRPDPDRSLLGQVAADALFPGTGPDRDAQVTDLVHAGDLAAEQAGLDPLLPDDATVRSTLCRSGRLHLAYVTTEQDFQQAVVSGQDAPSTSLTACVGVRYLDPVAVRPRRTAQGGDLLLLQRGVARVDPPPSDERPTPSAASRAAADALVTWLRTDATQAGALVAAGFEPVAVADRAPAPAGAPLGPRQRDRLTAARELTARARDRADLTASVVLAVDVSGSMSHRSKAGGPSRLAQVEAGLPAAAADPGRARLGLVVFGGAQATVLRPSAPATAGTLAALHQSLAELVPAGSTPLAAGLDRAVAELNDPPHRDAKGVLLVTDGPQQVAGPPLTAAVRRAAASGVKVRVVVLGGRCSTLPDLLRTALVRCSDALDVATQLRSALADLHVATPSAR